MADGETPNFIDGIEAARREKEHLRQARDSFFEVSLPLWVAKQITATQQSSEATRQSSERLEALTGKLVGATKALVAFTVVVAILTAAVVALTIVLAVRH